MKQHTIKESFTLSSVGLHTGLHVTEGVISIGGDTLTEDQQNVLEQVDRESKTRKFLGVLQKVFLAACFLIALYHLYTAAFGPPLTLKHRSLHVAMMLALAFAPYAMKAGSILINNPQVVTKSYPHFWEDLKACGFEVKSEK